LQPELNCSAAQQKANERKTRWTITAPPTLPFRHAPAELRIRSTITVRPLPAGCCHAVPGDMPLTRGELAESRRTSLACRIHWRECETLVSTALSFRPSSMGDRLISIYLSCQSVTSLQLWPRPCGRSFASRLDVGRRDMIPFGMPGGNSMISSGSACCIVYQMWRSAQRSYAAICTAASTLFCYAAHASTRYHHAATRHLDVLGFRRELDGAASSVTTNASWALVLLCR